MAHLNSSSFRSSVFKYTLIVAMFFPVVLSSQNKERRKFLTEWQPTQVVAYDSIPVIYNKWWEEICSCAKLKMTMPAINWFYVEPEPGIFGFVCPQKDEGMMRCDGFWKAAGPEIFIIRYKQMDERTIKHEMLHEILWRSKIDQRFMSHHKLFKKCKIL